MSVTEVVRGLEQPKVYTDLMIDLETLGLTANSVVLSIGAVFFDLEGEDLGPTFYTNVDRESCVSLGMDVVPQTVAWWSEQSAAARAGLFDPPPVPVVDALKSFYLWASKNSFRPNVPLRVWSHGAAFDIPLIRTLAQKTNSLLPWSYKNEHDTRTLLLITSKMANAPRAGITALTRSVPTIAHHALEDSKAQASWVQNMWKTLHG
jgi:hypothetical protein